MAKVFRPLYTRTLPDGTKVTKQVSKWYGRIPGQRKPVALSSNRKAAERMLAEKILQAERGDRFSEHVKTPVSEHLDAWAQALRDCNTSETQVSQVTSRARRVVEGIEASRLADLSPSRVSRFLATLRAGASEPVQLPPDKATWTCTEMAALLGCSRPNVWQLCRRHRLAVEGQGKGRRQKYPRSTVEALVAITSRGIGQQTSNHYLASIKQFTRWLVADKRLRDDPLAALHGQSPDLDLRRDRRAFDLAELRAILAAAEASPRVVRGLTGADRRALYLVACCSGFRAEELASLTPASFDLAGSPPTVTLARAASKNKRGALQPLPADVAELLRGYLDGRAADAPVWPGTWHERAAEMLRIDLEAAGVPYRIDTADGPVYGDMHSLRHSYISLLDGAGATLKMAMQLARHSDPKLTAVRYGRRDINALAEVVERLPSLTGGGEAEEAKESADEAA